MDLIRPIDAYPWARIRPVAAAAVLAFATLYWWPWGGVTPVGLLDWFTGTMMSATFLWVVVRMMRTRSTIDQLFYLVVVMPAVGFYFAHAFDAFRANPVSLLRDREFRLGLAVVALGLILVVVERRFPQLRVPIIETRGDTSGQA